MSRNRTPLHVFHSVTNSALLSRITAPHEDNLDRDAGLQIDRFPASRTFWLSPCGKLFDPRKRWATEISRTPEEVFRYVEDCRRRWQEGIVKNSEPVANPLGGEENDFPFQDAWDFRGRPKDWLCGLGARLALAGEELFFHLFEEGASPVLARVAARLREGFQERQITLTVTSDSFFVPWGMLYVHPDVKERLAPDGSNFQWEGFLGYKHVIEHNTQEVEIATEIKPNASARVPISFNFDERIDRSLKVQCIGPQVDFLLNHARLHVVLRRRKRELWQALIAPDFADRIVYFCCHGKGGTDAEAVNLRPAQITLSDDVPITDAELAYWLRLRGFASHPIVFVNACQGGQLTTLFYQTLAAEFLRQKAMAVLGAQVDLPAVFACAYAQRFFELFLSGASDRRVRIGPLMRALTREFIDVYRNPLGLVYSLYRGADCFVAW